MTEEEPPDQDPPRRGSEAFPAVIRFLRPTLPILRALVPAIAISLTPILVRIYMGPSHWGGASDTEFWMMLSMSWLPILLGLVYSMFWSYYFLRARERDVSVVAVFFVGLFIFVFNAALGIGGCSFILMKAASTR